MADGASQSNCLLTIAGTGVGNRAEIRNGVGAAGLRIVGTNRNAMNASWARFVGLGSASLPGVELRQGSTTVQDVEFDGCGLVTFVGTVAGTNLTWRRIRIVNAVPQTSTNYSLSMEVGPANYTGTRVFEDIVVGNGIAFFTWPNAGTSIPTMTRCSFFGGFSRGGTLGGNFVDCHFHRAQTSGSLSGAFSVNGNVTRGLLTVNAPTGSTCDGLIIDGVLSSTGDQGEILWVARGSAAESTTVRNVLATRSPTPRGAYGKFINLGGNTGFSGAAALAAVEHCTAYAAGAEQAFIKLGDGYSVPNEGYPGIIGAIRHNVVVGLAANSAVVIDRAAITTTADVKDLVAAANVTDNSVFNIAPDGTNGNGHKTNSGTMWTGTIPTYTERTDTPQFVEERNLATWYRSLVGGTPGTRTDDMALALDALASQWSDSPVAGATTMAAWTYLREGYRPQNAALNTGVSSNNDGWQGAVAGVTPNTAQRGGAAMLRPHTPVGL